MNAAIKLLMHACLFAFDALFPISPPKSFAEPVHFACKKVSYKNNEEVEIWIIDKTLNAVSRVKEMLEPARFMETTSMLDVEVLAKEIRGWDPASNVRFQILLDEKIIILEGYFLNCSVD